MADIAGTLAKIDDAILECQGIQSVLAIHHHALTGKPICPPPPRPSTT
jgi:hypothetical protein